MLPPPLPPGPSSPSRPRGPGVWALTLRVAIGATFLSGAFIALRVSGLGPRPRSEAEQRTPGAVATVSLPEHPEATKVAAAPPPTDPRLVPFHGLLEGVTDYEDIAQNRPYAVLAEHTRHLTDEEAARVLRGDLDYGALVRAPHLARGELLRVDGLLIKLEPVRLVPGAGPAGVEDAWRGWIMEPGGDECFIFDYIGDPPAISKRDLVRVEGTFLKVVRYENAQGRLKDTPFLIARRAWALEEKEIERPFRWDYVVVVGLALFLALLLVQRRRAAHGLSLLDAKRLEIARRFGQRKTRDLRKEEQKRPPEEPPHENRPTPTDEQKPTGAA